MRLMPVPVALLLLVVTLGAPTVAASNLPDPTWIGGLYDNGDEDAVLSLVWDQSPGLAPTVAPVAASWSVIVLVIPAVVYAPRLLALPSDSRAPPLR